MLGLVGASSPLFTSSLRAIEPIKRSGPPRFHLSLVAYSFRDLFNSKDATKRIDLFQFIDFAAEHGFDGVELTQYYFPKEVTAEYLAQLRSHAFLRGVTISGTGTGSRFAMPRGEKFDEQLRDARKRIDYAAAIGAPFVRMFSGGVAKDFNKADALKNCIAGLEECADYAGQKGIFIGLENDQGMTTTVEGTLEIIQGVKSKWLAANLDTGNFHETTDVYGDLVKLAPYAINVHFKSQIHPKGKDARPMDIQRVLKILRNVNYQGFLAVEYEGKDEPLKAAPALGKKIRKEMKA
ncbi:MAG: Xylose isomerase protein barrel [Verrucomicrobiales bacterium]|nr:Xylose isomerase protein barrel [Verrucomicrobiales bacterium]